MSQPALRTAGTPLPAPKRRRFWAALLGSKFLLVSIIAHLLFAAGATYFIVQRVQAGRKLTFQGGPPSPNPSKRALEHKVSMAKKRSGGAPPQAHRIVSAGISKIALPEMPSLPAMNNSVSNMMSGMGGAGIGQGMGFGSGMGGGMGGGAGGGGGLTMFGFHTASGGGLPGELYDFKQTKGRRPSGVDSAGYGKILTEFIKGGWNESVLQRYYKASKVLYVPQLCIPNIDAALAPKAFDVEKEVQPKLWVAVYKGKVTAPESGTFHFVGCSDDILLAKFNGRTVFNGSLPARGELGGADGERLLGVKPVGSYNYNWPVDPRGRTMAPFPRGEAFSVQAGDSYPIEIMIGEWPGGRSYFVLLIEKDGVSYDKTSRGAPILPIFRMANAPIPANSGDQVLPPHLMDGPIWRAEAGSGSLLDTLNQ